jgi:hypothetical protein
MHIELYTKKHYIYVRANEDNKKVGFVWIGEQKLKR